jgi:DNA (cytosine-5)-methyltransferase 1
MDEMIQVSTATRRIEVSGGNFRNKHVSVSSLRGFLPADCYGGRGNRTPKPITIQLKGLNKAIETVVPIDGETGKPRREFQGRGWVREFFKKHNIRVGSVLELERLGNREYQLSLGKSTLGPSFSEFFAGIGLVRVALEREGFHHVFANDIDPQKLRMYSANFGESDFRLGDIQKVTGDEVPSCDLATASFPCTDLSIAGAMNGIHSGESSMFWEFIRIIEEMGVRRPPLILLENVPGFLMSNNGGDLAGALQALNGLGYACDLFQVDASHFVPQSRLRLFVVGRASVGTRANFGEEALSSRDETIRHFIISHPDIDWRLLPLPRLPRRQMALQNILEDLPDDHEAWWDRERAEYFFNQLSPRHLAVAKAMIAQRHYSYGTAFRRVRKGRSMAELRTDGVAGCLRTPRGGSGRQILFRGGKGRYAVRLLTGRECARLQGVPDSFPVNVPLNQSLFGFGDAVCVPVIEWIAHNYLKPTLTDYARAEGVPCAK